MTAEDHLRSQLRNAASSMPVGTGSLAGVQARAAQLQRRRSAMRGGAGAFALAAVALVGVVTLRDGGVGDFPASVDADSMSETDALPASTQVMAVESSDIEDMADEADVEFAVEESTADEGAVQQSTASQETSDDTVSADEETSDNTVSADDETSDDMAESEQAPSPGDDLKGAVFATTVAAVAPPAAAQGVAMSYSFSGGHAVAQSADDWYSYDGEEWQSVGIPPDIDVVAVDLSEPERIAILGVVRPRACVIEHVVGVKTTDGWTFARIDDGTPPTVDSELVDARVRVTDRAVEVERTERLWLNDECTDAPGYPEPTGEAARLVADLVDLDEIQRQSWHVASFEPDFVTHWSGVARDDAHAAAAEPSDLVWTAVSEALYTVAARELTSARSPEDEALSVELHRTTMLDTHTSVEVSAGMAMLNHGDQSWEVCPIPDVDQAHGEVGWAGENLAVVVGKPEQTLFVVARTE